MAIIFLGGAIPAPDGNSGFCDLLKSRWCCWWLIMIFRTDWDTFETFSIPFRRENWFAIADTSTEIVGVTSLRLLQACFFTIKVTVKENVYKFLNIVKTSNLCREISNEKSIFSSQRYQECFKCIPISTKDHNWSSATPSGLQ